jgi:hypothetical protein
MSYSDTLRARYAQDEADFPLNTEEQKLPFIQATSAPSTS